MNQSSGPTRDPDRYISNNLQGRAWDAIRAVQASARKAGLNPSMSDVVLALANVAEAHPAPVLDALSAKDDA